MNKYFDDNRKQIVLTLLISVFLIPGIISLILLIIKDPSIIMYSCLFFGIGILWAFLIIFIPYFLSKNLKKFVKTPSIQDFLLNKFDIIETKDKKDKYFVIGNYNDYPFNICFAIDNRHVLSMGVGLICTIDFMIEKDKEKWNQFIQEYGYYIIPTLSAIEYNVTYDNKKYPKPNEISQICDKLIEIVKQRKFKTTKPINKPQQLTIPAVFGKI